jgi:hypothetical protein
MCCEISEEISLLYFGLDAFCQFEARVPIFDAVFSVQCTVYSVQCTVYSVQCTVYSVQCTVHSCQGQRGCVSSSGTLASKRQNTESPKYKDNNCLLISQYLISACSSTRIEYLLLQTTIWEKMDPKESFNIFRKLFPNFLRNVFKNLSREFLFLLWLTLDLFP